MYACRAWESFDWRILNVATTSSAEKGWPSWNLTPLRSWKVQVFALFDDFHDVASMGRRTAFLSAYTSCSPASMETPRAPSDCSSGGSSEPSTEMCPMRIVPDDARPAANGAAAAAGAPESIARNGMDMPSTDPRLTSSVRVMAPVLYSSMSSFSRSPAVLR